MIVTEQHIVAALQFHEAAHIAQHGPSDGVSLPKSCSRLVDLLGAMWYAKESCAEIPDTCEVANLIRQACATAMRAPNDQAQASYFEGFAVEGNHLQEAAPRG